MDNQHVKADRPPILDISGDGYEESIAEIEDEESIEEIDTTTMASNNVSTSGIVSKIDKNSTDIKKGVIGIKTTIFKDAKIWLSYNSDRKKNYTFRVGQFDSENSEKRIETQMIQMKRDAITLGAFKKEIKRCLRITEKTLKKITIFYCDSENIKVTISGDPGLNYFLESEGKKKVMDLFFHY